MTLNAKQPVPSFAMRPSQKPRIILILLIALCGLFVYSYTSRLGEKARIESEIVAMQAKVEEAKAEQYELLEMLEQMNQSDYIDQLARKVFDYGRPGDIGLIIVDEPSSLTRAEANAAEAAAKAQDYRNFPVWRQWVVFFTTDTFKESLQ